MKKFLAALLSCLALCSPAALAALTINSQESGSTAHHSASSPSTSSFTNTSGTFMLVAIDVNGTSGGPPAVSAVSYNSVALSPVSGASGGWCFNGSQFLSKVFFYYLEGPATGSNTISITWSDPSGGTIDAIWSAITFTGENSGGPVTNGSFASASASNCTTTGTAASVSLTGTVNGDYIVNCAGAGSSWSGATSPATMSAELNNSGTSSGDNFIMSYQTTSGGTVSTGDTISAADVWGIAAVEVVAATTASTHKSPALGVGN